jgi:hypothetical protein
MPILQHMLWNRPEEKVTLRSACWMMAVAGGINIEGEQKDLKDLHASAVLAKDLSSRGEATWPPRATGPSVSWKELKGKWPCTRTHCLLPNGRGVGQGLYQMHKPPHIARLLPTWSSCSPPSAIPVA